VNAYAKQTVSSEEPVKRVKNWAPQERVPTVIYDNGFQELVRKRFDEENTKAIL